MAGWMKHRGRDTYEQECAMNCGMACVAMAINRVDGSKPTTLSVQATSRAVGGWSKYVPAWIDRTDFKATPMVTKSIQSDAGSAEPNLEGVLDVNGINAECKTPTMHLGGEWVFTQKAIKSALKSAKSSKPCIVGLQDPPHLVLCEGPAKGKWFNQYVFVDPADGHVYTGAHVSDNKIIFHNYDCRIRALLLVKGAKKGKRKKQIKAMGFSYS